jgi:hydrogenase large subunit
MAKTTLIPVTEAITKTIDPMTRIEGHLGVKIEVENAEVVNAWSSGLLWRGFEHILLGRDPRDAPIITSRICGVCHAVHRLTSILALEDSVNLTPTPDAIRIRNIEQGINFIYSHAAHIFVLAGPDYDLYGMVPGLSEGDPDALTEYYGILKEVVLPAQRLCHEIGAIFGGKTPHHMTTLPGGVTCVPTENAKEEALKRLNSFMGVVEEYELIPTILSFLEDHRSELSFGAGCGNFLSYGVFPDPETGEHLLDRGVIIDGAQGPLEVDKITEAVTYSWYTDDSGGKPAEEIPPKDYYGKQAAYSWLKSPRYNGKVCEVGPLARMVVSGHYTPHYTPASVYDRLKARALEMVLVLGKVKEWITDLTPGAKVYVPYENPESAMGTGLWEAPRGANGHWVKIKDRKIEHYQVISPTNWNASPRDDKDQLGPMEQALIGTPVDDPAKPMNALKTVRSFDPCIACAVHVVTADGKSRTARSTH